MFDRWSIKFILYTEEAWENRRRVALRTAQPNRTAVQNTITYNENRQTRVNLG